MRRVAQTAALALVLAVLPGCDFIYAALVDAVCDLLDEDPPSSFCDDENGKLPVRATAANSIRANEYSFYAPPGSPVRNAKRRIVPVELHPPFRVEMTVGLCDPDLAPGPGASFGGGIAESAGGTGRWYTKCRVENGLTTTSSLGGRTTFPFPGAQRVDLAFQHDGTDLIAFARDPEASATWQEIGRETLGTTTGVFLPDVFALDLPVGTMTSVYALKFPQNGASPPGASPQREAVREMAAATTPLVAADAALHGLGGDAPAAANHVDAARARVDAAVQRLGERLAAKAKSPEDKALASARARLVRTSKSLKKAAALLRSKGMAQARRVDKSLGKALKEVLKATDAALPADLRAAIGGYRLADILSK